MPAVRGQYGNRHRKRGYDRSGATRRGQEQRRRNRRKIRTRMDNGLAQGTIRFFGVARGAPAVAVRSMRRRMRLRDCYHR